MDNSENNTQQSPLPLSVHVEQAVEYYFTQLNSDDISNLYNLVMSEVEKPLLAIVFKHSGYNQTKAAQILGLSRSTLRKKIESYQLF